MLAAVTKLGKEFVFTITGKGPVSGFSKHRATFDELFRTELQKMAVEREAYRGDDPPHGMPPAKVSFERWTVHDLRRTARSLMSQAGIAPDHAERALGHAMGGIRGVYDWHDFLEEKRKAFDALAAVVARIVDPQPNVVPMRRG